MPSWENTTRTNVYSGLGDSTPYESGIDPVTGRNRALPSYNENGSIAEQPQGEWVGGTVGGVFVPYSPLRHLQNAQAEAMKNSSPAGTWAGYQHTGENLKNVIRNGNEYSDSSYAAKNSANINAKDMYPSFQIV